MLEVALKKHSGYSSRHHYGVCQIDRSQWFRILDDWTILRANLIKARLITDVPELRVLRNDVRPRFLRGFARNCARMAKLIEQTDAWIRTEIESWGQLYIGGI